jgi:hypothetical protein
MASLTFSLRSALTCRLASSRQASPIAREATALRGHLMNGLQPDAVIPIEPRLFPGLNLTAKNKRRS